MKRLIIYVIVLFSVSTILKAQGNRSELIASTLNEIEENNTTLKALKLETEAVMLENKTNLTLADPEFGFNYLWGSPSSIGKRKDFTATQSFDFTTLLGYKKGVANNQNLLAEIQYKKNRIDILLEAEKQIIELISYNSLIKELDKRLDYANQIVAAYQKGFDLGENNILDLNKAKMEQIKIKNEVKRANIEKEIIFNNLKTLNGNIPIDIDVSQYNLFDLPSDFETWYAETSLSSPVLEYANATVALNKEQLKYNKSLAAPTISAGYMMEDVVGEKYQGITLGMSIPIWSNKNRIKQAKTAIRAAESAQNDAKIQFFNNLNNFYIRSKALKEIAESYAQGLIQVDNAYLLKKALDAGKISLLDYIVETHLYYELIIQAIDSEKEYRISLADLYATEL